MSQDLAMQPGKVLPSIAINTVLDNLKKYDPKVGDFFDANEYRGDTILLYSSHATCGASFVQIDTPNIDASSDEDIMIIQYHHDVSVEQHSATVKAHELYKCPCFLNASRILAVQDDHGFMIEHYKKEEHHVCPHCKICKLLKPLGRNDGMFFRFDDENRATLPK